MDKTDLLLGSLSLAAFFRLIGVQVPEIAPWAWGIIGFGAAGDLLCLIWAIAVKADRDLAFLSVAALLCLGIGLLLGGWKS